MLLLVLPTFDIHHPSITSSFPTCLPLPPPCPDHLSFPSIALLDLHHSSKSSQSFKLLVMATKLQSSILVIKFLVLFFLSATPFTIAIAKPHEEKKFATNYYGGAGFFGRGDGFNIPNFGIPPGFSGGYGGGYGGPGGGYGRSGTFRTPVVCRDIGPCYKKSLVCPAKCFQSYSSHGRNSGGGGGGGGCTIDCKSKCIAYC